MEREWNVGGTQSGVLSDQSAQVLANNLSAIMSALTDERCAHVHRESRAAVEQSAV